MHRSVNKIPHHTPTPLPQVTLAGNYHQRHVLVEVQQHGVTYVPVTVEHAQSQLPGQIVPLGAHNQ